MPDPENVPPWYLRGDTAHIGIRLSDVELAHSVDHRAITVSRLAPRWPLSVQGLLSLIVLVPLNHPRAQPLTDWRKEVRY